MQRSRTFRVDRVSAIRLRKMLALPTLRDAATLVDAVARLRRALVDVAEAELQSCYSPVAPHAKRPDPAAAAEARLYAEARQRARAAVGTVPPPPPPPPPDSRVGQAADRALTAAKRRLSGADARRP
jgi:hypothetical protein